MNDECLVDYKYYFSERFNLFNGDSRQVLRLMKDNSIDSVVCDPPYELGFMGKSWDSTGIANDVQLWKEVLRVLKPGGHLLAFSGSRTYHRMAVAIEDAGFEIRDQIMWVYGSGFPKSYNIAKGIEGTLTNGSASWNKWHELNGQLGESNGQGANGLTKLNASHGNRPEQYASHGFLELEPTTAAAKQWQGWGTALKPAHEPIVLARKTVEGTVANNVLTYGVGGINIDGTRVGSEGGSTRGDKPSTHLSPSGAFNTGHDILKLNAGRFPANFIHDGSDEIVELLGEPARFFYCAKANKRDRNEGCENLVDKEWKTEGAAIPERANRPFLPSKNHHPTVKPTDLMQYLCRLITPPNGTILDPFLGSGSTGKAAMYEGFNFVGIELTEEYLPIAKARIEFALANLDEKLF
jgi:site-specific DNA-methyltransferase (adenine-specific)